MTDLTDAVSYAHRHTGYRAERDDIEQQVRIVVWRDGLSLETIDRPLLFTIAKREAYRLLRHVHNQREMPVAYQASAVPSHGAMLMRTEPDHTDTADHVVEAMMAEEVADVLTTYLAGLLATLPEDLREVAALHAAGLDGNQIATRLAIQPQTARLRLSKARSALGQNAGDLEHYRRYQHPEAKTSKGLPEPSAQLLAALQGYITL